MLKRNQYKYKNISLNYVYNTAEGPSLVLLHGLSDRWQTYLKLIPLLIPYYSINALDLRGHGLSSRAKSYRIIDYAKDIESFLSTSFFELYIMFRHLRLACVRPNIK